eukprot:7990595-Pyramimonas_sp.AAC.1
MSSTPLPWAYGGIRHRRRVALMATMKILIWKLIYCKLGFMLKSHDMRSAVGTGHVSGLVDANRESHPSRHFSTVLEHYRAQAIIRIDAADDTAHVHPRSGGRMGDPSELYKPIHRWKQEMPTITGPLFQTQCPVTDQVQDLGTGSFIDDLVQVFIIHEGS